MPQLAEPTTRVETPPDSAAAAIERSALWHTAIKYGGSLVDQSLVSGTRFLTSVLVGSVCGAAELGTYALCFSVVLMFQCVQISLINRPYAVFGNQVQGSEKRQLAGSTLIQFAVFAGLCSVLLWGVFAGNAWLGRAPQLAPVLAALAVGLPLMLFREHARQFCFANLNVGHAVVLDAAFTVLNLAGIGALAWWGHLSAATALLVAGLSSAVAGGVWLLLDHRSLLLERARVIADFRRQVTVGKWDCASELAFQSQIQGLSWLLVVMLDTASVGIYAACMMSIQVMNPIILGVNSLLVPKASREYSDRGVQGLQQFVGRSTLFLAVATAVLAIAATAWGPWVLEWIYRAQGFDIPVLVVAALSFGVFVESLGTAPENGLWAMERHDQNFRVEVIAAVGSLICAVTLISSAGLAGAALAFLAGRALNSAAHWVAYRAVIRERLAEELSGVVG